MRHKKTPEPRIGTSGWHYKHWIGSYYPEKTSAAKMLGHYVRDFDTVEVNNSFYKLPLAETIRKWRDAVPEDFVFAVKASRYITHNLKLKDPQNALDKFLPVVEILGEKLGPVLFQLPPKWKVNVERLEEFLALMPRSHRYAFELREPSWMCAPVYRLLRKHNAALCIFEIAGYHTPLELTANWTYVRLHGPGGKYQGSYPAQTLAKWAHQLRVWQREGIASYVYFDNDEAGYAAKNALELKQQIANSN